MTSHKTDATYKKKLEEFQNELQEFRSEVKASADTKVLSAKASSLREGIQKKYHDLSAYLKRTFNVQQDDVAYHKLQQMAHKVKELGYDIKSDFLKEKNKSASK